MVYINLYLMQGSNLQSLFQHRTEIRTWIRIFHPSKRVIVPSVYQFHQLNTSYFFQRTYIHILWSMWESNPLAGEHPSTNPFACSSTTANYSTPYFESTCGYERIWTSDPVIHLKEIHIKNGCNLYFYRTLPTELHIQFIVL